MSFCDFHKSQKISNLWLKTNHKKLMSKGNYFFDHIKSIIKDSGQLNSMLITYLLNSSFDEVVEDSRTVHRRANLIRLLVVFKLLDIKSVRSAIAGEWGKLFSFGKDVLYKVKNNTKHNWRKMLLENSYQCTKGVTIEIDSKDSSKTSCFIIDDTDISKKGKSIEWIGRIFSHVTHRYDVGFKSLNLAYWSGKHLLHLDFSYHVERGKKGNQGMKKKELENRYTKQRDKNTPGYKRCEEVIKKKTDCAISMLRRALSKGYEAQYILVDSWFFNITLAKFAIERKVHLISRPKFNNWKYTYKERTYTIGQLVKKLRYSKDKKWNRQLRLHFISINVKFKDVELRLFLFKEKKRGTKWQAIITTNKTLSALKAYRIYQNRWAIESSYKELKQYLGYGKSMSRDFDGQIADATHVLMVYNMLSHIKAIEDHQTIGQLFGVISQNWLKPTIMQKFWRIITEALSVLADFLRTPIDDLFRLILNENEFLTNLQKLNHALTTET